jgi:uncharacterized protein
MHEEGDPSPFHAAELELQRRFGRRAILERPARRAIRDHLIQQHRDFYRQLAFIVVGSVNSSGQPWASLLPGPPGFAWSPDIHHLRIDKLPHLQDPLAASLATGGTIGLLGIELHTRRRNRMNGLVSNLDANGWTTSVLQSYGNCSQYIQQREIEPACEVSRAVSITQSDQLSPEDRILIESADTFFIASANLRKEDGESYGADVSHRGGPQGFVRVGAEGELTVPDYIGNFFFNTLGNLQVNPRAGLAFPDFVTGSLLLLSARARVTWEGPAVRAFEGAQRLMHFEPQQVLRLNNYLPFRSVGMPEYAPECTRGNDASRWLDPRKSQTFKSTIHPPHQGFFP